MVVSGELDGEVRSVRPSKVVRSPGSMIPVEAQSLWKRKTEQDHDRSQQSAENSKTGMSLADVMHECRNDNGDPGLAACDHELRCLVTVALIL